MSHLHGIMYEIHHCYVTKYKNDAGVYDNKTCLKSYPPICWASVVLCTPTGMDQNSS